MMTTSNFHWYGCLDQFHKQINRYLEKEKSGKSISKSHLCNILTGRRTPSAIIADALVFSTGIPLEMWLFPKRYGNPQIKRSKGIIAYRNKKRKEGRKTKPATTKL